MPSRRGVLVAGVLLLTLGATVHVALPVVFGRPRPLVDIAWRDGDAPERPGLERQLGLTEGQPRDDGFWTYVAVDSSAVRLESIVTDPRIASTRGINRRTFEIDDAPLTERRGGWLSVPRVVSGAARRGAVTFLIAGALLLIAGARYRRPETPVTFRAIAARLARGIPPASAKAAGLFRIVFALLLVAYFWSEPVYPELFDPLALDRAQGLYGAIVQWLASRPAIVSAINPVLLASGLLFAAGAFTRITYPLFTLAVLLWSCVYTLNLGHHSVGILNLALLGLLPARWSDAWSVDSWWRDPRAPVSPRAYGYVFWFPGLVLGVAFAAAAWSKVGGGAEWIINGTVRYHFATDLDHAWVDWGPRLTRSHAVAIVLSAGAVAVEAVLVTAAFSRRPWYRMMLGASAVLLLAGFAAFQGVLWPAWWILLLAFLPWQWVAAPQVDMATTPRAETRVPKYAWVAAMAIVGVQFVASAAHVEARPIVSAYDMYSATYRDPDAYEDAASLIYRVVTVPAVAGTNPPECTVGTEVAELARRAIAGEHRARNVLGSHLADCIRQLPETSSIMLEGDRRVFDWESLRHTWKRRLDVIGPLAVAGPGAGEGRR
jgi:hypothetical protein